MVNLYTEATKRKYTMDDFIDIMKKLRAPDG